MTEVHKADGPVSQSELKTGSKRSRSSPSPQLRIDPASESTNHTISALDTTEKMQPSAATPGLELPGGYPYTPSTTEPGPSFEEIKDTAKEYFCAAGQYVPSQDDVKRMAQNAGTTVRGYIPDGVAAYLGPPQSTQEAVAASPIEESETTPTAAGSFVLINRGNSTVTNGTRGHHDAKHESEVLPSAGVESRALGVTNIPLVAHQVAASLTNGEADSNASTKTQPGSLALPSRKGCAANGTPFTYRAEMVGDKASVVRTVPAPPGSGNVVNAHPEVEGRPNHVKNSGAELEHTVASPKARAAIEPQELDHPSDAVATKSLAEKVKEDGSIDAHNRSYERPSEKDKDVGQPQVVSMVTKEDSKDEKLKNPSQMERGDVNTMPQAHALGNGASGVPLEGGYQANLDRGGARGLATAESRKSADPGIRAGGRQREGAEDSETKPNMNKVYSSTATAGHDEDTSENPTAIAQSKFAEPSPSHLEGTPGQSHGNIVKQPQQPEPSEPLHDSSITAADTKETTNGKGSGPVQGERQGRKKGGFLNKIKGWSKRLSQDKKGQNGTIDNL